MEPNGFLLRNQMEHGWGGMLHFLGYMYLLDTCYAHDCSNVLILPTLLTASVMSLFSKLQCTATALTSTLSEASIASNYWLINLWKLNKDLFIQIMLECIAKKSFNVGTPKGNITPFNVYVVVDKISQSKCHPAAGKILVNTQSAAIKMWWALSVNHIVNIS